MFSDSGFSFGGGFGGGFDDGFGGSSTLVCNNYNTVQ